MSDVKELAVAVGVYHTTAYDRLKMYVRVTTVTWEMVWVRVVVLAVEVEGDPTELVKVYTWALAMTVLISMVVVTSCNEVASDAIRVDAGAADTSVETVEVAATVDVVCCCSVDKEVTVVDSWSLLVVSLLSVEEVVLSFSFSVVDVVVPEPSVPVTWVC